MSEPPQVGRNALQLVFHGFNGALSGKRVVGIPGQLDDPDEPFRLAKWWCDEYPELGVKVRQVGRNIVFDPVDE